MDNREAVDFIAFGIMLGSRSLAAEWMDGWEWEGHPDLKRPYNEMKAGKRGAGMDDLLKAYVREPSSKTVTQQILGEARLRQARVAVKIISNSIENYLKLGASPETLTEQSIMLSKACLRLFELKNAPLEAPIEDFDDEETCEPGHGGVVEG